MSSIDDDMISHESMGTRKYARAVDLPVSARVRVRIGRAIENAMRQPNRCGPTLRRVLLAALPDLRAMGLSDEAIVERLGRIAEAIAHDKNINERSLVSGRSRWEDVQARIADWIAGARAAELLH